MILCRRFAGVLRTDAEIAVGQQLLETEGVRFPASPSGDNAEYAASGPFVSATASSRLPTRVSTEGQPQWPRQGVTRIRDRRMIGSPSGPGWRRKRRACSPSTTNRPLVERA